MGIDYPRRAADNPGHAYVNLQVMKIELREVSAGDPDVLRLVEALRDEVESRGAHNGAARPGSSLAEAVQGDCDTVLAYSDTEPVGTGALRELAPGIAEIKRMYVVPEHRGAGVAKRILGERGARTIARPTGGPAGHERAPHRGKSHVQGGRLRPDRGLQLESPRRPLVSEAPRLSFHNSSSRAFPTHG